MKEMVRREVSGGLWQNIADQLEESLGHFEPFSVPGSVTENRGVRGSV